MPEKYGYFMTVDQKKAISRRTDSGKNEHEQWYNVWRVLFPNEDKPSSPYLKSTELEELIPIVRWFWKKNSSGIVCDILSRPQTVTIAEAANASYTGTTQAMGQDEDKDTRRLTKTMDVLLDRVEESIQSFGRYRSPSPPSSVPAPSPLLSEASTMERTDDSLRPSFIPKIEVNELQDNQNTPRPSAVEIPSGIPETDFWEYNVFGMPPTDFSGSYDYPDSFVP
ncbi:HET and ankyrin domain protein [Colletotrichum tofieldiae]|nr:HET and ankyrin domain protein [Colletotrichum tofieldiae]GKT80608.1 HET and ankyrin domain protein [Colletotrichum tofieldiae]